jgi:hypothetical protein
VDSSGVEIDRYEMVERPNKKKGCFEKVRRQIYLKYHIVAILDYLNNIESKSYFLKTFRFSDTQEPPEKLPEDERILSSSMPTADTMRKQISSSSLNC